MPRRSLGKNHLVEFPLTYERMRSAARSPAHTLFFNVGEECLAKIGDWKSPNRYTMGPRSRFVGPKASLQHKLQDTRRRSGPPMVSFLPIFAKPPLTLKTNGHQQAAVEPDLESLLLAAAKPPRCAMNHGAQKELPLSLSLNLGDQEGGVSLSGSPALSLNKHPEDGSGEDVVGI